ncbi:peptide-N(4)-(N-acetyl-beta-glucosaminyl)asparagine amidase [Prorops nasuta]|uniref:peptide-N(4)-(N-acetyl-beta- glucosaminyl)asparagine amidase n=1 Tax=Prorops nasuta TaxID=863751 RepID=UPI0034CF8277
MDEYIKRSVESLRDNEPLIFVEASKHLSTICSNILKFPTERKYRQVYLGDPVVEEKLFPAAGAIECLLNVGFIENGDHLLLPQNVSLSKLKVLYSLVSTKPTDLVDRRKFFEALNHNKEYITIFEDEKLQEKARQIVPITELEIRSMKTMRQLQRNIKLDQSNKSKKSDSSLKEDGFIIKSLFLLELMQWFKYEFFQWFDSPICTICNLNYKLEDTKYSDNNLYSRIEVFRCEGCNKVEYFPRYDHPEPLLKTRRGRCGEWVKVFTLLCRSFGYDTRFILDYTDHVWSEVWSDTDRRWLHVDCCENTLDQPLMYEKGWNKNLTYVIAFSKDEIQDVTWRYTRNPQNVLKRRKFCSEEELSLYIESSNRQLQSAVGYSIARRKFVLKRRALELADMLFMPNSNSESNKKYQERTSGSLAWRLSRGECTTSGTTGKKHVWNISQYGENFKMIYNIVKDVYKVFGTDESILNEVSGWENGVELAESIFRKVENDWKMVYIARTEKAVTGKVMWTFEITHSNLCLKSFHLQASSRVFHNASILWKIEAVFDRKDANQSIIIPDCTNFCTDSLNGAIKLSLIAIMSDGEGDSAWQHAQLFRENLNNLNSQSMFIAVQLRKRSN